MSLVCVEYQGSQVNIGSGYGLLQQDVTLVEVDPDLCRYTYIYYMASPGSLRFIFGTQRYTSRRNGVPYPWLW